MTELLTLREVSAYLRVTAKTIYRLLRQGNIPATKVGHQWRFDKVSIDEWLQRKSVGKGMRILVVDDDEFIGALFREVLGELGHRVIAVLTGHGGLELVKNLDFDLVFLDLKMPGMDGAKLFRQIKAIKPKLPVTIITGYPDSATMALALAHGPLGVMPKPFGESDIITAVNNFLALNRTKNTTIERK